MIHRSMRTLFLIMVLSLLIYSGSSAQDRQELRIVTVSGEGIVKAEPDMVIVRFGVVTRDKDPEKARALNDESGKNTLNTVRALGVPERKIRLEVLQLNELREYNRERRTEEPMGFEAVRQVVVELDDIDLLPALVTRISQHGANRLFGITYDIANREPAQNEALVKAITNAKNKASVMAETLGVKIGKVYRISEQSFSFPGPIYARGRVMDVAAEAAMPVPEAYSPGEIEVRANVQVEFLIE
jgi:uncharacterized protein